MTDEGTPDGATVSLAAVPTPLATVEIADGEPVLERVNEPFTEAFADVDPGTPAREWFRSAALDGDDIDADTLATALVDGERREAVVTTPVEDDQRQYRLQTGSAGGVRTLSVVSLSGTGVPADRIATVLSHDLRNPLDVAKAHLQAARETGEDEHFEKLAGAHDRMERIIQDVLTLSRGASTVDPVPDVAVDTVAADAWATVDTRDGTVAIDEDLPSVEADPDRLQRLFENLFRNAVEHGSTGNQTGPDEAVEHGSTDGGRSVTVSVRTTDDGFAVDDDGPGIPAADRDRVFDPGYSDGEVGTGMGLTIVDRIARAHGWTVAAERSDDGGARFRFTVEQP